MIRTITYPPKSPRPANGGYRYFFNGQEADNEVLGDGALHAFEYRMHDTRTGRFWSVDPLAGKFPWNSVYAFAENRVVDGRELEGLEYISVNDAGIDPDKYRNEDGSYSFALDDYGFPNVSMVSWEGNDYFKIDKHMYYNGNGWSTTGTPAQKMTQWVYTDIQNFQNKSMHVFTWGDSELTGLDHDGDPKNLNCAYLAAAQAKTMRSFLVNGVVSKRGALNYNGSNLERLNCDDAVDYINRQLELGKAVVVGVTYTKVHSDKIVTDHYVVISGRTTRNGQGTFTFLENAVLSPSDASNFRTNILQPKGDGIYGKTTWKNKEYRVTRVQKNKQ